MKKTILLIFILIPMMFFLCGCGNKEVTETNSKVNVEENDSEELEMNGTGEIKLKEFIESPKVLSRQWEDVTINEVKTTYNVNENNESNTIDLTNGNELWISYSGKDGYAEIEKDGVRTKVYTEDVSIRDVMGVNLRLSSQDLIYDDPLPEKLNIGMLDFELQTNAPGMDDTVKKDLLDKSEMFYPYIKENNCNSLEAILNALGMKETDKTIYEAIENKVEYDATYNSEYGEVRVDVYTDEQNANVEFIFEDENCEYDKVSITEMKDELEDGTYSSIEVVIIKNYN